MRKLKLTNQIVTVVGKKGTGKTSRIKELIIEGKYDQIFILDYLYEYRIFANAKTCVSTNGADVENFCKDSWSKCDLKKKSVIIFDEIHLYGKLNFNIDFIYRCGRHANLDVIASAQRFFDLPTIVRSQTDRYDTFCVSEPRDLEYLGKVIDPQVIETVRNLKVLQYVQLTL